MGYRNQINNNKMEAVGITIGMIMAAMIVMIFTEIARRVVKGSETLESLARIASKLLS